MTIVSGVHRHYRRFIEGDVETRTYLIRYRYLPWMVGKLLLPLRYLLAILLRVVLSAVKPLVHIRFGRYMSVSIGAWVIPMELYLCQKREGLLPKRTLDIFYHWNGTKFMLRKPVRYQDQVCNEYVHSIFKRVLNIKQIAFTLDDLNRMLPKGSETFQVPGTPQYDAFGLLKNPVPDYLAFSQEEEQAGQEALAKMGVTPGSPFVCFYARDGVYISQNEPPMTSLYGTRDENLFRNSDIETYLPAVNNLTRRGYFALRVGKLVDKPLQQDNPMVIDYASRYHSDFLDVYLAAKCAFFIGMNGGIIHLPSIYRRPMALANLVPLTEMVVGCEETVFIPKKFYSAKSGRLLTFREILSEPDLAWYTSLKHDANRKFYDGLGIELQDNTPEEILALTDEVERRACGSFTEEKEDLELQSQFQLVVEESKGVLASFDDFKRLRIGSQFLRENRGLLA